MSGYDYPIGRGFIYDGTFPLDFLRVDEQVGRRGIEDGDSEVSRMVSIKGQTAKARQSVGFSVGDFVIRDWEGTLLCIKPYPVPTEGERA